MSSFKQERNYILLAGAVLFCCKLSLLGKGACQIHDEGRYFDAFRAFFEISQGNLQQAGKFLFSTGGRPMLAFAHLPAILGQAVLKFLTGADPRSIQSLMIPQFWNVVCNLGSCYFLYKSLKTHFRVPMHISIGLAFVFGLMTDSNLHLRHTLPYDAAQFASLILFYYSQSAQAGFRFGFAQVLVTLIYPGYWPLACISLSARVWYLFHNSPMPSLYVHIGRVAIGCISCIAFMMMIAAWMGQSFWGETTQSGSNFVFDLPLSYDGVCLKWFKYLFTLDGVFGLGLGLVSVFVLFYLGIRDFQRRKLSLEIVIGICILFAIVVHSLIGMQTQKSVFYGRMYKQFTPFLFIFFYFGCSRLKAQNLLFGVFLFSGVLHYAHFMFEYTALSYPREILAQYFTYTQPADSDYDIVSFTPTPDRVGREAEFPIFRYFSIPPGSNGNTPCTGTTYTINCEQLDLLGKERIAAHVPPRSAQQIYHKKHYMSHDAYAFEWLPHHDLQQRHHDIWLSVYCIPSNKSEIK
jgi:hypothetical protein